MVAILQALKAVRSTLSLSALKETFHDASTEVWNHPVGILEGCRRKATYFSSWLMIWSKVSFEPVPYRQCLLPDAHGSLFFSPPLSFLVLSLSLTKYWCHLYCQSGTSGVIRLFSGYMSPSRSGCIIQYRPTSLIQKP